MLNNCGSGLGFGHYAPSFPLKQQTDFGNRAVGVKQPLAPCLAIQNRSDFSFGKLSIVTDLRFSEHAQSRGVLTTSGPDSAVTGWLSRIHAFDFRDISDSDDPTGIFASGPNSTIGL